MKYLALVAACLLTVTLASPATAADSSDPVEVTFPAVTAINPEHTPYTLEVHDPQPELGELVVALGGRTVSLPHDGSITIPLSLDDAVEDDDVIFDVLRCPVDGDCVTTGITHYVHLVTFFQFFLVDDGVPLGLNARLPLDTYYPQLAPGDVVDLSWTIAATRGSGATVTSGAESWVVGDPLPVLEIPASTTVTSARLTVQAMTDSAEWGRLEGTSSEVYQLDVDGPPLPVRVVGDTIFPAKDGYLDRIEFRFSETSYDLQDLTIDLVDPHGDAIRLLRGARGKGTTVPFNGWYRGDQLPAGRYTLTVTGYDQAGNTTVRELPIRIDDRRRVKRTFRQTIPAARSVADKFVGACSHLGSAAGRGWGGSLGLYSAASCSKENGSIVLVVGGARVPASVGDYPGDIQLSLYGGAARGSGRAYLVHGWFRAKDDEFIERRQFNGKLGTHQAYGADAADVVRNIKGQRWVYWQVGLSEGSRYDVKSFTISTKYYELVSPRSRTASDAKTIAEPSGAPGPGYTVPKTDAAELPAAYKPSM